MAFWQKVIDEFYTKYAGIRKWHDWLVQEVMDKGKLVMPTGREYEWKPFLRPDGSVKWPRTQILNYPVQGLGADLVAIARVTIRKRLMKQGLTKSVLLFSTVHDSIDLDVDGDIRLCYNICALVNKAIEDVPTNFYRLFGVPFDLPLKAEVAFGPNLKDLTEYASNSIEG